jgi:hypothetical protein
MLFASERSSTGSRSAAFRLLDWEEERFDLIRSSVTQHLHDSKFARLEIGKERAHELAA